MALASGAEGTEGAIRAAAVAGRRRSEAIWLGRLLFGVALLAVWQFVADHWADPFWTSSPALIGDRLVVWLADGQIFRHTAATLSSFLTGFFGGAVTGVMLAVAALRLPRLFDALQPYISAVYSLPKVALAPLFILWFGIGLESKIALVWFITIFVVFWNGLAGLRSINRELLNSVRVMGANQWQLFTKIELPGSVSWVLTGMKIAMPLALHGAIAAEIFGSNRGLGYLIAYSGGDLDTTGIMTVLVVLIVLTAFLSAGLNALQRAFDRWR